MTSIRFNFSFTMDDPDVENFYFITMYMDVYKIDTISHDTNFYANQYAEILTGDFPLHQKYVQNGLIFKDNSFNGTKYSVSGTATTYADPFGDFLGGDYEPERDSLILDTTKLYICLHNLSDDLYKYHSSFAVKLQNENNLYSEPSSVYSNIENGFGIVGGENIELKNIIIEY